MEAQDPTVATLIHGLADRPARPTTPETLLVDRWANELGKQVGHVLRDAMLVRRDQAWAEGQPPPTLRESREDLLRHLVAAWPAVLEKLGCLSAEAEAEAVYSLVNEGLRETD